VDSSGNVLGRHRGLIRYTVGQRRGLGISSRRRLYVCGKSRANNTVVLGEEEALYAKVLFAEDLRWTLKAPEGVVRVRAKTGYRRCEQRATVERVGEDRIRVGFDEPQRATAAGQAVVLYDGDVVVGGGTIAEPAPGA
jgi:tRNA-specific 2-thiouridylase